MPGGIIIPVKITKEKSIPKESRKDIPKKYTS
jgi:hypothetical protein